MPMYLRKTYWKFAPHIRRDTPLSKGELGLHTKQDYLCIQPPEHGLLTLNQQPPPDLPPKGGS